jgi:phosphoglycolate phosphatase
MSLTQPASAFTIAFDLGGTLAATGPDILNALNASLAEAGLDNAPRERLNELISLGQGPRRLIEHCFGLSGQHPDASRVQAVADRYVEIYCDNVAVESTLFPDCRESLEDLARHGYRLAVCTNKPERLARALLEALGVLPLFAAVAGRDTFAWSKPDPRHLVGTVLAAGGDPGRCIMVGDTHVDVATARSAQVPIICVSFGYSDVPAEALAADALVHDYRALHAAIADLQRKSPARNGADGQQQCQSALPVIAMA